MSSEAYLLSEERIGSPAGENKAGVKKSGEEPTLNSLFHFHHYCFPYDDFGTENSKEAAGGRFFLGSEKNFLRSLSVVGCSLIIIFLLIVTGLAGIKRAWMIGDLLSRPEQKEFRYYLDKYCPPYWREERIPRKTSRLSASWRGSGGPGNPCLRPRSPEAFQKPVIAEPDQHHTVMLREAVFSGEGRTVENMLGK